MNKTKNKLSNNQNEGNKMRVRIEHLFLFPATLWWSAVQDKTPHTLFRHRSVHNLFPTFHHIIFDQNLRHC